MQTALSPVLLSLLITHYSSLITYYSPSCPQERESQAVQKGFFVLGTHPGIGHHQQGTGEREMRAERAALRGERPNGQPQCPLGESHLEAHLGVGCHASVRVPGCSE